MYFTQRSCPQTQSAASSINSLFVACQTQFLDFLCQCKFGTRFARCCNDSFLRPSSTWAYVSFGSKNQAQCQRHRPKKGSGDQVIKGIAVVRIWTPKVQRCALKKTMLFMSLELMPSKSRSDANTQIFPCLAHLTNFGASSPVFKRKPRFQVCGLVPKPCV